ncbi:DNA helicase, putative [Plasmodium vinckei brucechwatti]|uniref:DNA helicase, putative n=1 Tax=Plasmodium vinckei brucechwatti TaxID=119398 RepID=A0A6V7RZW0_PLAVN|nr:DNA helicase, putative [Plasmodium vinckei brucechwatti]
MDVCEFVDPIRKRKITNNLIDFDKYIYKEKSDKCEEEQSNECVIKKKKKKKLRRVLDSSNSDSSDKENIKKEYNNECDENKKNDDELLCKSYEDSMTNDNEIEERKEYERNLKKLYNCLLGSIKVKNKIIKYFTQNVKEKRQDIIKEFVKGSFRINNYDADFEDFEKNVDTFHKLKKYQKCGVYWLYILYKEKKNGILADEMGLGKTAQTCVFLDYMYKTNKLQNKTIIVAPTSLLKNWDNEIDMWCPYLKNHKIIYYGNQNERKYLAYDIFTNKKKNNNNNTIHLIITSINMLTGKNDAAYFRQIRKYDYLIFDEAHFLKNKNSLIYKKLQKKIVFSNKILLTGSPIQNKTQELTNLLLFLMPHIFTEQNINAAMDAFLKLYQEVVEKKDRLDGTQLESNTQSRNYNIMDIYEIESEPEEDKKNKIKTNKDDDVYCVSDSYEDEDNENNSDEGKDEEYMCENTRTIIKNYLDETIKHHEKNVDIKNKEIILLQLIIEPYILRRSKKHVFIDMPKKHSIIIKLPLNNTQLDLYKDEILSKLQHTHKHLEFLQTNSSKEEMEKLKSILEGKTEKEPKSLQTNESNSTTDTKNFEEMKGSSDNYDEDDDKIDEETINIEKEEENEEESKAKIIINKREDEEMVRISHVTSTSSQNSNSNSTTKEERGKMINASIFILRRICNHPLLHKYYYSVDDIKKISKYFYNNTDQYLDLDLKTVENEFMKISDFDIHLSIKHLISQGDNNLNKYLIDKKHILNSTKIHHMLTLIKNIKEKKEKVLIFSQYTTFLDIIEESLLYEFIYDENDYAEHSSFVDKTQSVNKLNNLIENDYNDEAENEHNNDKQNGKFSKRTSFNKDDDTYMRSPSAMSTSSQLSEKKTQNNIYVRLDGSTNTIERQQIIKEFSENDNVFIFLLSTKAGGVGLNLIAANHVILMDQDWNPHNDRQAEDRVHRLGQKKEVYIYRLCCKNTIEETVLKCCKAKLHLDQAFGGNSDLLQTAFIKDALNVVEMK